MAVTSKPEIILYDLACTKNVCFSPAVWRVRLLLNYKRIPYKTVFLEFADIEPTLKRLGVAPSSPEAKIKYTVPTIHHLPSDTHLMDSVAISSFLQEHYPTPPFTLSSNLGREIEIRSRGALGKAFRISIAPRELHILSADSQEYFRLTREADLGHPLEDLLKPEGKEDEVWESVTGEQQAVSDLLRSNHKEGPFVLGAVPSTTDFFIAGALQSARVVDEEIWKRVVRFEGFRTVYEACLPWMENDH